MTLAPRGNGPRVLMLGAEYGPSSTGGGLGTACAGLAGALVQAGCSVTFVAPGPVSTSAAAAGVDVLCADRDAPDGTGVMLPGLLRERMELGREVPAPLSSYGARSGDRFEESARSRALDVYANRVLAIALRGEFDLVYAHDWPTFPAAEAVKRVLGLPLVCHVHSTEVERSELRPDPRIARIELHAFAVADRVVAVGRRSAEVLREAYGVRSRRITIVPGALADGPLSPARPDPETPCALFAGRFDPQKAPLTFVRAAALVAGRLPRARFLMAGEGGLRAQAIELAAESGLARSARFPGFLTGDELEEAFRRSSVFVCCSREEPFGLAALEALARGVPAIVPARSGVADLVKNVVRVERGGVEAWAQPMLELLRSPLRRRELGSAGRAEVAGQRWSSRGVQLRALFEVLGPRDTVRRSPFDPGGVAR